MSRKIRAAFAAAMLSSVAAEAVYVDPDGMGQALIYPYYTVRSNGGNPFNTYLSVTNADAVGKVVRVRFREGREGREAAGFNLYLAPGDMWTGAVVPDVDGATVISADRSCTEPALATNSAGLGELPLRGNPAGGAGARDETREGYVEIIEMGTLRSGSPSARAISHSGGTPTDCGHVVASPSRVPPDVQSPGGRLAGTLTLLNVASGLDSTLNATALAALSTQPFFRPAADPYPDFDAAEVTPASVITTGGKRYRLLWARGVDAISSVMMVRTSNEFVLDSSADSLTDWVFTMPTRRLHRTAGAASPPFTFASARPGCETLDYKFFDREARGMVAGGIDFPTRPPDPPPATLCHTTTIWTPRNGADHMAPLFGSANQVTAGFDGNVHLSVSAAFQNGWGDFAYLAVQSWNQAPAVPASLSSLAGSTATDLATGAASTGAFRVLGLPVVGFMTRTYSNGGLGCDAGRCQGNYAAAFPHNGVRVVEALP